MEDYYSVIKDNEIGSFVTTWMDLESVIQSEVREDKYCILIGICGVQKNGIGDICEAEIEAQTQRTNIMILRGKRGVGELRD